MSFDDVKQVFHKRSLENAPENWHSDPIYAKVFKSCMLKVLAGKDEGGVFPLVKVMEKSKKSNQKGTIMLCTTTEVIVPAGSCR